MRETSSQIDEAAAAWALRVQENALGPDAEAELQAWLDADPRHFGAYTRAEAVLSYFDRAAALKGGAAPRRGGGFATPMRRRVLLTGGIAASVAGLVGAGAWTWSALANRVSTRKGEVRMLALEDGSRLTLDTESAVQTAFSPSHRLVRLLGGVALFDVAKDASRPFVVVAGGTQVRAVGTSFSVHLLANDRARVVVREGKVEVTRTASGGRGPAPLTLTANMSTFAADEPAMTAVAETTESVDRQLAWSGGMLDFDEVSLDHAAAEFGRYSDYALEIDPEIASQRITGRFTATDSRAFARAAAESLGLKADFGEQSASLHR